MTRLVADNLVPAGVAGFVVTTLLIYVIRSVLTYIAIGKNPSPYRDLWFALDSAPWLMGRFKLEIAYWVAVSKIGSLKPWCILLALLCIVNVLCAITLFLMFFVHSHSQLPGATQ